MTARTRPEAFAMTAAAEEREVTILGLKVAYTNGEFFKHSNAAQGGAENGSVR